MSAPATTSRRSGRFAARKRSAFQVTCVCALRRSPGIAIKPEAVNVPSPPMKYSSSSAIPVETRCARRRPLVALIPYCGESMRNASPVTDPDLIHEAHTLDAVCIPGTFTPTEMFSAHRAGAELLKIFPAPADLPAFITQVRGPFPEFRLFPTAGVTLENVEAVLKAGAFGAGFVASLFKPEDIASGNFEGIEARARGILEKVRPFLD